MTFEALQQLGSKPLLILSDYDGTLAPIVDNPQEAYPAPGVVKALSDLHYHSPHRVWVVSGRLASEVRTLLKLGELSVVGLHGLDWPGEPRPNPDRSGLQAIGSQLVGIEGLLLEDKGWTLAAHYRTLPEELHDQIEARLARVELPQGWEMLKGKKVREFRPKGYGKGAAITRLVQQSPGHHPVFLGDDQTDEEGFEVLNALGGTTVKVGEGQSLARHRLPDSQAVYGLLNTWSKVLSPS